VGRTDHYFDGLATVHFQEIMAEIYFLKKELYHEQKV